MRFIHFTEAKRREEKKKSANLSAEIYMQNIAVNSAQMYVKREIEILICWNMLSQSSHESYVELQACQPFKQILVSL